ncbi:hypothetical protein BDQ12DRAFT_731282 [Crucibulum laeve]|uniref:Fork head domain-containing protein n=1 Tax=Crucibulum laeve TaxID=68775 RepID=A0A5C3MEW9_9AGAR|nr:hypothetical protein BDQ12DRAFT_731282 [Crucibulum laeve]
MDTRTRSASPTHDMQIKHEPSPPPQDKISAYYSLVFPHFTFYIQTLSITIGRRCAPNPSAATSSTAESTQVDVDLGALKSVSRLHAKIEYDQEEDRFVLVVIGRNGAWVDGVWSAAGTRAPLGERSQIQIASRTFHFVLPPPPPPEDTPSPSSQSSSANRARSPSVDITSISPPSSQPSHSPPPPVEVKLPPPSPEPQLPPEPQPQLPNSNAIGKSNKAANSKKRKKSDGDPPPVLERRKPEDMPPKPQFTYAQLIYRAIKSIGGKATLQEICTWIMNTYEYYRYADTAWMSSVRHNLSSGRAFTKMERCGGDRGKGFFWSIDDKYAQSFEDQELKSQQAAAAAAQGGKDGLAKGARKKDKALLEPPLKRSVKDVKGGPLPPPLTNAPLAMKTIPPVTTATASTSTMPVASTATTGVFAYPTLPNHTQLMAQQSSSVTSGYSGAPLSAVNPYAPLTQQQNWSLHPAAPVKSNTATPTPTPGPYPTSSASVTPGASASPTPGSTSAQPLAAGQPPPGHAPVPDVVIPIILGPIPPTHPDYSPNHPNNSAKEGYMVLHERKLILDPDVFSGLTKEMLADTEKMGARAALVMLTGHMVKALKERRAKGRGKDRGARRARGGGRSSGSAGRKAPPPGGPFTHAPLESRRPVATPAAVESESLSTGPQVMASQSSISVSGPVPAPTPTIVSPSVSGPTVPADPGSPILIVDDSDDEGPAMKKRRLEGAVSVSARA